MNLFDGNEIVSLTCREVNGFSFKEIPLNQIDEAILQEIWDGDTPGFDNHTKVKIEGENGKSFYLTIIHEEYDDSYTFNKLGVLDTIKLGLVADKLFSQGKSVNDVLKLLWELENETTGT